MKEVIVRLTSDHIKVKGAEYVRDLVRCDDCKYRYMDADFHVWTCTYGLMINPNGFCNYGEVRDE